MDGHFGYLPHLPNGTVLAAELAPNNLCDAWAGKVTNNATALLIPWTSGRCTFSTVLANAQSSGAAAAVLYPDPPSPLVEISCSGSECDVPISIPATMMDGRGGALIAESLRSAAASLEFVFSEEASWGRNLGGLHLRLLRASPRNPPENDAGVDQAMVIKDQSYVGIHHPACG